MGIPAERRKHIFDFLDQKSAAVFTSVSRECRTNVLDHIIRREMRVFQKIIAPALGQYSEEFVDKEGRTPLSWWGIEGHPPGEAQVNRPTECITGTDVKAIEASIIALIRQIVNSRLALSCEVGRNLQAHFARDILLTAQNQSGESPSFKEGVLQTYENFRFDPRVNNCGKFSE